MGSITSRFKGSSGDQEKSNGTLLLRSSCTAKQHSSSAKNIHSKWPSTPTSEHYLPWKWTNQVKTHKYTWLVFPFASFLKQCLIVTNFYFIMMGFLQLIPEVSDSGGSPTFWMPVGFVIGVTMIKEFTEEWSKHKFDRTQNSRETFRLDPASKKWESIGWGDVVPGDIIRVECDEEFPCDLLLLTSTDPGGIASVETVQLDGETNLKMKQCPEQIQTKFNDTEDLMLQTNLAIAMGPPNDKIYQFSGVLFLNAGNDKPVDIKTDDLDSIIKVHESHGDTVIPVGKDNFLWRGASLKATKSIVGMALYTGHKTRLFMNSRSHPTKRTALTRKAYHHIFIAGGIQILLCVIMSALTVSSVEEMASHWYLRTDSDEGLQGFMTANITSATYSFFISFGRLSLLLSQLVPITLLVQIELSHWVHSFLMSKDDKMTVFYDKTNKDGTKEREKVSCTVNAVDVLDDLGCITHIFSDKTGTLTQNLMQFRCVSFGSHMFGMTRDRSKALELDPTWVAPHEFHDFNPVTARKKLINSLQKMRMKGDKQESYEQSVNGFKDMLRCLAVCHTVVVKQKETDIEFNSGFHIEGESDMKQSSTCVYVDGEHDSTYSSDTDSEHADEVQEIKQSSRKRELITSDEVVLTRTEYEELKRAEAWLWEDLKSATTDTGRRRDTDAYRQFQFQDEPQHKMALYEDVHMLKFQEDPHHQMARSASEDRGTNGVKKAHYTAIKYPRDRYGLPCYDASSPDEMALVCGAKDFGVEFVHRSPTEVCVAFTDILAFEMFGSTKVKRAFDELAKKGGDHLGPGMKSVAMGEGKDCSLPAVMFPILDILEFDNDRKKMSVIIRDEENKIRVLTKGADSCMLESAATGDRRRMNRNLDTMSQEGLRTLVYGQRLLSEHEWTDFSRKLLMARSSGPAEMEAKLQGVIAEIEYDLEIIGCSGINDKLQDQCGETIADIKEAGISLWVLTGDKIETAISIGHSCNLLTQDTYNCIVKGDSNIAITKELNNAIAYILAGKMASGDIGELQQIINAKANRGNNKRATLEDLVNLINFTELKGGKANAGTTFRLEDMETVDVNQVVDFASRYIETFEEDRETRTTGKFKSMLKKRNQTANMSVDYSDSSSSSDGSATVESMNSVQSKHLPTVDIHGKAQMEATQGLIKYGSIALTVSGPSLEIVFTDPSVTKLFFALANLCSVVIACRVTPAQKAQVVSMTKKFFSQVDDGRSFRSLAIGDGANDVNMILTADVGIGIRGKEGLQAAQNADIAIGKFMFLKNLLFVHGHEAVRKNSLMIYHTLWKNIVFGSVCFWYAMTSMYSAVDVFNAWLKQLFNLVFTAGPIMFFVWFDTYLPYHIMMANARLYPIYSRPDGKMYFGSKWFIWWLILGLSGSALTVFLGLYMLHLGEGTRGLMSISFDDAGMLFFCTSVFIGCITVVPFVSCWTFSMFLIYVLSIVFWYIFWIITTYTISQDVYGSFWSLNTTVTYHAAALAICSISFLLIAIWWLYKVLFRPTLQVIISERIAMGVDDDKMLGKLYPVNEQQKGTVVIPVENA